MTEFKWIAIGHCAAELAEEWSADGGIQSGGAELSEHDGAALDEVTAEDPFALASPVFDVLWWIEVVVTPTRGLGVDRELDPIR